MILIIGGAYQGKLEFAKKTFGIAEGDLFDCTGGEIDFSRRCINYLEEFVFAHPDAADYFKAHRDWWQDSILICRDIFCGVVPMGKENRTWRQNTGRLMQYLAAGSSVDLSSGCWRHITPSKGMPASLPTAA